MKKPVAALAVLLFAATALLALEVAGVKVPDTVTVEGKALKLNGAGLRKKAIFKVYVLGLFLETPSKDAAAIIAANETKSARLYFVRNVEGAKVSGAIVEGFENNSKDAMPQLKARLDQLAKMIPDVKEGDEIALTWVPDKGTQVSVRGTNTGTIEGRDFADALFSVWIGPNPVQEDLKQALVGS